MGNILEIILARTDPWESIYGRSPKVLPNRMRYLHPIALCSIRDFFENLVFSDIFRSPAASMAARKRKKGVQKPGWSAHNFGLAIDIAIQATLRKTGWSYRTLVEKLQELGWVCYRRNFTRGREEWHFTFSAKAPGSRAVEEVIMRYYKKSFDYDLVNGQIYLSKLRLYDGEIDGLWGNLSSQAVSLFQKQWDLRATGRMNPRTKRLLAVVGSTLTVMNGEEEPYTASGAYLDW